MPEKITKAQRWLDLVVFLLRHRLPVSVEQVMENVRGYASDWAAEDEIRPANVCRKITVQSMTEWATTFYAAFPRHANPISEEPSNLVRCRFGGRR